MRKEGVINLLAAAAFLASAFSVAEAASTKSIIAIVEEYLDAHAAINQLEVDENAFKRFGGLFTPDIVYEIPGENLRFEGDEFLNSEVPRGHVRNTTIKLDGLMIGKSVALVRITQSAEFKTRDDKWRAVSIPKLLVFEFEDGKIKRIIDY